MGVGGPTSDPGQVVVNREFEEQGLPVYSFRILSQRRSELKQCMSSVALVQGVQLESLLGRRPCHWLRSHAF